MGRVVIGLVDVAVGQHLVEDVLVATQEPFLALLARGRVETGRVVEDGGEGRGLGQAELGGRLQEVRLGGRLDAVGAPAEVDGVEVALQDLLLGHLPAHLHGQDQLPDLAARGAFGTQVEDLDVLLGDGGAALHVTAAGDGPQAAEHAGQGEPRVAEESGVLGRHHRVLHHLRHLVILEGDAVLHSEGTELLLPVVVIDERGVGGEVAVRVRQFRRRVQVQEGAHPSQTHDEEQHEHRQPGPRQNLPGAGLRAFRRAIAFLLRLGHRLLILLFHKPQIMR